MDYFNDNAFCGLEHIQTRMTTNKLRLEFEAAASRIMGEPVKVLRGAIIEPNRQIPHLPARVEMVARFHCRAPIYRPDELRAVVTEGETKLNDEGEVIAYDGWRIQVARGLSDKQWAGLMKNMVIFVGAIEQHSRAIAGWTAKGGDCPFCAKRYKLSIPLFWHTVQCASERGIAKG
jgi:hypothetical protein